MHILSSVRDDIHQVYEPDADVLTPVALQRYVAI